MTTLNLGNDLIACGFDLGEKNGSLVLKAQIGSKMERDIDGLLPSGWVHYNTTGGNGYQLHIRKPVLSAELSPASDLTTEECRIVADLANRMGDPSIAAIFDKLARAAV